MYDTVSKINDLLRSIKALEDLYIVQVKRYKPTTSPDTSIQIGKAIHLERLYAERSGNKCVDGDEKPIIPQELPLNIALEKFYNWLSAQPKIMYNKNAIITDSIVQELMASSVFKDPKHKPSERDAAEYPKSRSYPSKLTSLVFAKIKHQGLRF